MGEVCLNRCNGVHIIEFANVYSLQSHHGHWAGTHFLQAHVHPCWDNTHTPRLHKPPHTHTYTHKTTAKTTQQIHKTKSILFLNDQIKIKIKDNLLWTLFLKLSFSLRKQLVKYRPVHRNSPASACCLPWSTESVSDRCLSHRVDGLTTLLV